MNKVYVSRATLRRLFLDNGIWDTLRQGLYTCDMRDKVRYPVRPGSNPAGGTQIYHKWKDLFGRHTVTTHMVVDAEGWPVHWDEKDLILGDTKYIHHLALDS